jgi:hypothetical protein
MFVERVESWRESSRPALIFESKRDVAQCHRAKAHSGAVLASESILALAIFLLVSRRQTLQYYMISYLVSFYVVSSDSGVLAVLAGLVPALPTFS